MNYSRQDVVITYPAVRVLTIAVNLLATTLAPAEANPFIPNAQINPNIKIGLNRGFTIDRPQFYIDQFPVGQIYTTNPLIGKSGKGFTFSRQLLNQEVPFVPVLFKNPELGKEQNRGFTLNRPQFYTDQLTVGQIHTVNPLLKRSGKGFTFSKQIIVEEIPFTPIEFRNPDLRKEQNRGFTVTRSPFFAEPSPSIPVIFRNPDLRKEQNKGFTLSRPTYSIEPGVVGIQSYELPRPRKREIVKDWIWDKRFYYTEPGDPIGVNLFPNPLLKIKKNQDWIDRAPFHQLYNVFPDGSSSLALPVLRLEGKPQDITQARPQYYVDPVLVPLSLEAWPNPLLKKRIAITFIDTRRPTPIIPGPPFRQNDWPKPLRKKIIAEEYEFHYITDSNLPEPLPGTQITFVPLIKKKIAHTWIQTSRVQVISSGPPFVPYNLAIPVRLKRQTHTWIQTFTALTTPAPGEKPFFETNYPNPLIGGKNFHSGWIDRRRFYFEEPPIQIGQHTWPVFRAVKRNHVGFIDFKIQSSDPRFVTVDNVPLRKKVIALTFVDNPVRVIIAPSGLTPFANYDWPLFLKVKSNKELLTWLGQNPQIFPPFNGRIICLQISETEYILDMQEADYDLDMREGIYDLDMGGEECE